MVAGRRGPLRSTGGLFTQAPSRRLYRPKRARGIDTPDFESTLYVNDYKNVGQGLGASHRRRQTGSCLVCRHSSQGRKSMRLFAKNLYLASALAALCTVPSLAAAADIEVIHWWTSKGES